MPSEENWVSRALEAELFGRVAEALACLAEHERTREEIRPADLLMASTIFVAAHRFAQAKGALEQVGAPDDPDDRVALTECWIELYVATGAIADEEKWCRRFVAMSPKDGASWIYLGSCLERQGRLSDAEEAFREAARADGCAGEAATSLGKVLRSQGRFADAANVLREALRHDPDLDEAREALADVEVALSIAGGTP